MVDSDAYWGVMATGSIDTVSGYDDNRVSLGVRLQSNLMESRYWFRGRLDEVRCATRLDL